MAVALGALALTGSASAAKLHGVVVQHNRRAHSLVLALRGGRLASVHSHRKLLAGRVVVASVRKLRNGTFASRHIKVGHQLRHTVRVHGVVTFVNRRRGEFTVSAGGASLLIRTRHGRARTAVASSSILPSVGDEVTVETQIDDQGDLEDQGVQNDGTETQSIEVEGTVLAVDTANSTLTISADDEDDSGQSITVDVPSTFDISMFSVGDQVELTVSLQPDGTYVMQGSSDDENADQADDSGDEQGCQGDEQGSSCSDSSDSQGDSCSSDAGVSLYSECPDGSASGGSDQGNQD